jgi:hypothetical protein
VTQNTGSYTPNPALETDYIIEGFLHALVELAPASVGAELGTIRLRVAELERQYGGLPKDTQSRYNLRYACAVLAGYEVLTRHMSADEAVSTLRNAFTRSGEFIREKTRAALDQSQDAFREMVDASKQREALQFGPSFEFDRERDDEQAYLLNIRKCFWHSVFVTMGRPELTTVLCEFDRNWFDVISPERHGFRFERKTTLGYGGTHCPFHFIRVRPAR